MDLNIEYVLQMIALLVVFMGGYVTWQWKKFTTKVDNTYTKGEVTALIDLKLSSILTEISALNNTDHRLEVQLHRLEQKIDRLIDKL